MHPTFVCLNAAALLHLFAATAFAANPGATAHASVSNIRVVLVDLAPDDGITPYLSFRTEPTSGTQSSAQLWHDSPDGNIHHETDSGDSPWDAPFVSMTFTAPYDIPGGRVHGQASVQGTGLDSLLLESIAQIDEDTGGSYRTTARSLANPRYFYLSPNTELSISVDLAVDSTLAAGQPISYAHSYAAFAIDGAFWHAYHTVDESGASGAAGLQTYSATLTSAAAERQIDFYATSYTEVVYSTGAVMAAVPEPGGWAMMAAGMCILGGLARRTRRSKGQS